MAQWSFQTSSGIFSIVERGRRGVDLYFGGAHLGYHRSPVEAAELAAKGEHPPLSCAPENGKSLGLPMAVHEWRFTR
jgi:hypothetical protein